MSDVAPETAPRPKRQSSPSDAAKALFLNRLRSLFNIDGFLLPELTEEQQTKFMRGPVQYLIGCDDGQAAAIWREIEKRQADKVTEEFLHQSARVAIKALMSLEATAKMLERWAPETFPEIINGKKHFARVMMESAAEAIREAFANAIKGLEPKTMVKAEGE
jgi:hypothetical protein